MLKSIIISLAALFSSPSVQAPENSVTTPQAEAQVYTGEQLVCYPSQYPCRTALQCCSHYCRPQNFCL